MSHIYIYIIYNYMSHTYIYIYTYIITRIHTYIYIYMRKSSTNPEADSLDCEIFSVTLGSRLVLRKSLLTTLFSTETRMHRILHFSSEWLSKPMPYSSIVYIYRAVKAGNRCSPLLQELWSVLVFSIWNWDDLATLHRWLCSVEKHYLEVLLFEIGNLHTEVHDVFLQVRNGWLWDVAYR